MQLDITNWERPIKDTMNRWFYQVKPRAYMIKDLVNFPDWIIRAWIVFGKYTSWWQELVRKFQAGDGYAWITSATFYYDKMTPEENFPINIRDVDWTNYLPEVYAVWRYIDVFWWWFEAELVWFTNEVFTKGWFDRSENGKVANSH